MKKIVIWSKGDNKILELKPLLDLIDIYTLKYSETPEQSKRKIGEKNIGNLFLETIKKLKTIEEG